MNIFTLQWNVDYATAHIIQQHEADKHKKAKHSPTQKESIKRTVKRKNLCNYFFFIATEPNPFVELSEKFFNHSYYFLSFFADRQQSVCQSPDGTFPIRRPSQRQLSRESHSECGSILSLLRTLAGSLSVCLIN